MSVRPVGDLIPDGDFTAVGDTAARGDPRIKSAVLGLDGSRLVSIVSEGLEIF